MEKFPKIKFEQINIDKEVGLFYYFMKSGSFSSIFNKNYPELRIIQKKSKNKKECLNGYRKFLEDLHMHDKKQMICAQGQLQSEWEKIGPIFLDALSKHFETNWPDNRREIIGYVSELPVFPRFLDEYSFCIGYENIASMVENSAHEILHFLWFKKWKEIFPKTKRKEFESPYLVWRLSEIIDPIVLQCHPKIKELIKPRQWGYASFESIKIGDKSMTEYFKGIYLQSVKLGDNFDITLKKLWKEARKYRQQISNF